MKIYYLTENEIRIKDENGTRILQDATIDLANNELIFINPQGNKPFTPLHKFEKIEDRKGILIICFISVG